eukprot:scaffold1243_cov403-Prasinococcus_capsulatus_cf.AAC.12
MQTDSIGCRKFALIPHRGAVSKHATPVVRRLAKLVQRAAQQEVGGTESAIVASHVNNKQRASQTLPRKPLRSRRTPIPCVCAGCSHALYLPAAKRRSKDGPGLRRALGTEPAPTGPFAAALGAHIYASSPNPTETFW